MIFQPKKLDFNLSPYTGMTRKSWLEAGEYLLTGMFQNIKDFQDPVIMPRQDTKVTYPHLDHSKEDQEVEKRAEIFEGLCRTLFIAAPLIHENPDLMICGYHVRDYYKNQILRSCTPGDSVFVGNYETLQEQLEEWNQFRAFQQTVETCALVICLWECKGELWDTYTKDEKDVIADLLASFAKNSTVPQNWRLFNMLDMAFLRMEGYEIEEDVMAEHAQAILNYYAGDGWYRDGQSFDYYSCWAFNVYAPLWNQWYGYENEPYIAKKFEENSNKLMETFPDFFDRDGFTNMWGRSNIYRNAATSAFDGNMFLRESKANPGLARRIASGSLLQFLSRDDFLYEGVPTLGFYGQFSPLVQGYSCAESPYWLGKAFLCLHLPADHPFWTAKEENGTWERLQAGEVKETVLDAPGLDFTNHEANGETILRSAKVLKRYDDQHGMWNYGKLCFNTKYPWEAAPKEELESQQYVIRDITTGELLRGNMTLWHGIKDGILYRRQFYKYWPQAELHWTQAMNLADFTVPYGIFRVDKMRLFRRPVSFTLGSYGFPDNGTEIKVLEKDGAKAIVLKGKDHCGVPKQMAMTIYDGWEEISFVRSRDTNPDSPNSLIIFATTTRQKQYGGFEPYVFISQVITKESHEDFTEHEVFPVEKITYEDRYQTGAYGITTVQMKDGSIHKVCHEEMEGKLML